jgi:hypothetical protein
MEDPLLRSTFLHVRPYDWLTRHSYAPRLASDGD